MPSAKDIKRAIARIRAALPRERKVMADHREIRLGLERIRRIVPDEQGWIGVHVGGTNGKGSICALLAGMMKNFGIGYGTFTSPAMPERHNSITINNLYVNRRMYEMELADVEAKYRRIASGWTFAMGEDPGNPTPFEVETAAAFRIFNRMHVKYGIVEVGMGGATDATNIMKQKAVTVISKIDLDHQEYLGNSIEEIARIKAGIMRPSVPCIVDYTNPSEVIDILRDHARKVGTTISPSSKALPLLDDLDDERFELEDYEKQNLLCATLAFRHLFPHLVVDLNKLLSDQLYLPGRKDRVDVSALTGGTRESPVLVDGAHNLLGVQALVKHVDGRLRQDQRPVTWVMGMSASTSKPFSEMIETLVRPQDKFAFIEYTPGPNDPPAAPAELGRSIARGILKDESGLYDGEPNLATAVRWACGKAGEDPVVVTGSLYLIREMYKLEGVKQRRTIGMRRPGRAQLWYYAQLSQQRALTPEEESEFKQARRHWYLSPLRNPIFKDVQDGGKPLSPTVPKRTRQLQQAAAFHRTQASGYREGVRSIRNDDEVASTGVKAKAVACGIDLSQSVEELKRRHQEHVRAYERAMFKIRGHAVDPQMKYLTHKEIYRRPGKPRGRIASLLRKYGADDVDEEEADEEENGEEETNTWLGQALQDNLPQSSREEVSREEESAQKRQSRWSSTESSPDKASGHEAVTQTKNVTHQLVKGRRL